MMSPERSPASSKDVNQMAMKAAHVWFDSDALSRAHTKSIAQMIIESRLFKCFFAALLFANFILIVVETDRQALGQGDLSTITWTMRAILIMFILEIAFKVYVERGTFCKSPANIVDIVIICLDVLSELLSIMLGQFPKISWLRLLRLLRLIKVLRSFTMLRELSFMLHSLGGAMRAIVWAFFILFFMLTFCSILAVHVVQPYNEEVAKTGVYEGCGRCPRAFKTVMDANLTFLQTIVAGDSWGRVSVPIMEMFPWTAVLFSAMLISITLGAMNLILTCIVDKAMESRENDKNFQLHLKRSSFESACKELMSVWTSLDKDGNGLLSQEEVHRGFDNIEAFARVIRSLDLRKQDIDQLFNMMDSDGSMHIDYEEFVLCLHQLEFQNPRTTAMLMQHEMRCIRQAVDDVKNLVIEHVSHTAELHRTNHQAAISKALETNTPGIVQEAAEIACTPYAPLPSLDCFMLQLGRRFSSLLDDLTMEQHSWASCISANDPIQVNQHVDDDVPKERFNEFEQTTSTCRGRDTSSCNGGGACCSSTLYCSNRATGQSPDVAHNDDLPLLSHHDALANGTTKPVSSTSLLL